jgi:hypothetical protein
MSAVVLRCPHCGTTRAAPGECDACHEAEVRYYCTNHDPGRWLDAPACPACGARFGDPPKPPARPRRPDPPPTPPPARPATPRPPPAPDFAPEPARPAPGRLGSFKSPWVVRRRPLPRHEELDPRDDPRDEWHRDRGRPVVTLSDLLKSASRARRSRYDAPPLGPPAGAALRGCLRAAFVIALFLLVVFLSLTFLVGGWFLQVMGGF